MMGFLEWFSEFVAHLEKSGHLIRERQLDGLTETHRMYELHHPLALPSGSTLWRIVPVLALESRDSAIVRELPQAFIEYAWQVNVAQQVAFSDAPASEELSRAMGNLGIRIVNLARQLEESSETNSLFQELEGRLFPHISDEEVAELITSHEPQDGTHKEKNVRSDGEVESFLSDSIFQSVEAYMEVIPLYLSFFVVLPPDETEHSTVSTDRHAVCNILRLGGKGEVNEFIFPRIRNLRSILRLSLDSLSELRRGAIPPHLQSISDALVEFRSALVRLCLNVIYGSDVSPSLEPFRKAAGGLAGDDCLAVLLESFESRDIHAQLFLVEALTKLDIRSSIAVDALLEGAQSPVKALAVRSIEILGMSGNQAVAPVLEELKEDRRKEIRSAAIQALTRITEAWPAESRKPGSFSRPISIGEAFDLVACHAFFAGPHDTEIHIRLFDLNGDLCHATTHHPDGTFDVAVGKKSGLFGYIVRRLTDADTSLGENDVKMGETVVWNAEGQIVERIGPVGEERQDDKEKAEPT